MDNLPVEIIVNILDYLTINDIVNVSEVNKNLNSISHIVKKKYKMSNGKKKHNIKKIKYIMCEKIWTNLDIEINLNNYNIKYFSNYLSFLKNVHTLILKNCGNIEDVSNLGRVHTLDLSFCKNITDVSMLGNVHTLNLSDCNNITDVSNLGNVYTLDLSWCKNITDVSNLENVHTLNLKGCDGITNVF